MVNQFAKLISLGQPAEIRAVRDRISDDKLRGEISGV